MSIPVFANGNILFQDDIEACLKATGADGVMSAEGQLYNAALFAGRDPVAISSSSAEAVDLESDAELLIRYPPHADLALEYLSVVRSLETTTNVSGMKGHLFKLMRPGLGKEVDLRERLGRVKIHPKRVREGLQQYEEVCLEMKRRMDVSDLFLCSH